MTLRRRLGEATRLQLEGAVVDRWTQRWVVATGRRVEIHDHPWLDGPVGDPAGIGDRWIAQHMARTGADATEVADGGLVPEFGALARPGFDPSRIDPAIVRFYEHTASWTLDLWSRWSRWAEPGGRLIDALFARRLQQLGLPLDPLAVADGMASDVVVLRRDDEHVGTVWQRTLVATGRTAFGGLYALVALPDGRGPAVRVVFPLPNGSVTVLLRPEHRPDGGLRLVSGPGDVGQPGAYLVVRPDVGDRAWVRRVPLHETFDLDIGPHGLPCCDHRLALGGAEVLRLRYRMREHAP